MNVLVEMFNGSDYISAAPHSAGLNVYDLESQQVRWAGRQTDGRTHGFALPSSGFLALYLMGWMPSTHWR